MNRIEAEQWVGKSIRGRAITAVESSGGCTDKRLYLLDAAGERVMNVTNLTQAEVSEQNRLIAAGTKGARHRTG